MKTAIALLVLSLSLESTLLAIETQRRAAIAAKDFATLSTIYAADFRAIFGNGEVFDRAALFDVFRADDGRLTFVTDELAVRRLDAGAAIVSGRLTGRSGDTIATQQRFTHIYVRRDGGWEIVAAEGTPVRNPK